MSTTLTLNPPTPRGTPDAVAPRGAPGAVAPRGAPKTAVSHGAETLARTLHADAAARPVRAIEALAAMVANRARLAATDPLARARFTPGAPLGLAWPALLGHVCRAPFLFDCWNPRHPSHAALAEAPENTPALAVCRRIAARAATGALLDCTAGATHAHCATRLPGWAIGHVPTAEVGGLLFYRLGGRLA